MVMADRDKSKSTGKKNKRHVKDGTPVEAGRSDRGAEAQGDGDVITVGLSAGKADIRDALEYGDKMRGNVDVRQSAGLAQDNNVEHARLMAEIFKGLNFSEELRVIYENTAVEIVFKKWLQTNLKLHVAHLGYNYFEEELPQINMEPKDSFFLKIHEHACRIISDFGLDKPFIFRHLDERSYLPDQDPQCTEGFPMGELLNKCRGGGENEQFVAAVRNVLHQCRVVKGPVIDVFGPTETCTFLDGVVRHKIITAACSMYLRNFKKTQDLYDRFKADLPGAYLPVRPTDLALMGATYEDPDSSSLIALIPMLGPLAEDLMIQLTTLWVDRLVLNIGKHTAAEVQMNYEIGRRHHTESSLQGLTGYLNETKVAPMLVKLIFTGCMKNATVIYAPDIFSGSACEWIAAILVMLLFPEDVLDEASLKSCLILVTSAVTRYPVSHLQALTTVQLRQMVPFRCLRTPFRRQVGQYTNRVPFVSDPSFAIPFGMNMEGRHPLTDAVMDLGHEIGKKDISNMQVKGYLSALASRFSGVFLERGLEILKMVGTFACGVDEHIKNMPIIKPLVLESKEVFSLMYLYEGVSKYNLFREMVFVYDATAGLAKDANKIITAIRGYLEFKNFRGATSSQVDVYLDKVIQNLEQYGHEENGDKLSLLLKQIMARDGKYGISVMARRSENIPLPRTTLTDMTQCIVDVISDNLSSFGVTNYVILSRDAIPDYEKRYIGVFHDDDHPFRLPPVEFTRVSYDTFRRMDIADMVRQIHTGLVVDVYVSYSLNIMRADSGHKISKDNLGPLVIKDGLPSIVPFTVFAVENGVVSEEFEIMKLMLPRYNVYVAPRTSFYTMARFRELACSVTQFSKELMISPYRFEAQFVSNP